MKLPVSVQGTGPLVVMLHGRGADRRSWDSTLPHLDGYTALTVDLVGHGDAPAPLEAAPYAMAAQAADLAETLAERPRPFVLMGHSMGGMVGIHYALAHPDHLAGLVLICTAARPPAAHPVRAKTQTVYEELARLAGAGGMEAVCEHYDQAIAPLDDTGRAMLMAFTPFSFATSILAGGAMDDCLPGLEKLSTPCLVMAGALDEVFTDESRLIADRMPRAELVVFEEAGHGPQAECPKAFGEAIRRFLAAHPAEATGPPGGNA